MPDISTLGYWVINASDLDQWESFATRIFGLQVGARTANELHLRMDEREQRMIIERGPEDDLSALGWEFDNAAQLEAYIAQLRERDVNVVEGGSDLARNRRVEKIFYCLDPVGFRHEFFYGAQHAPMSKPFHSPVLAGAGFVTGRLGIGHVVVVANDATESINFYNSILGLRISDYIRDSHSHPGMDIDCVFMHTRTGRHHSLATAQMKSSKKINHLMIQVQSINDVGLAFDRVREAGIPVIMDIGHHPNDQMLSFYIVTPSGFGFEYGWGGIVIDENEGWDVRTYNELSDWGHRFSLPH
ncbi:VOC family protein [Pseudomonas sp.]|uniref:VOC family protein n=1 Tax=Pseudomonas sp. TaxID=306 RepID=UPI0031B56603